MTTDTEALVRRARTIRPTDTGRFPVEHPREGMLQRRLVDQT